MRSLLPDRRHVNGQALLQDAIADAHQTLLDQLGREIGARLLAAAAYVLGRAPYERRGHVPYYVEQPRACPQCGAVQSQRFSERFNRRLRRRIRRANACHLDAGVLAMMAQEVDQSCALPSECKLVTIFQPKAIH